MTLRDSNRELKSPKEFHLVTVRDSNTELKGFSITGTLDRHFGDSQEGMGDCTGHAIGGLYRHPYSGFNRGLKQ